MTYFLSAVAAYLLGSLSFAVMISKIFFHDDIRNHGSGNAGMTNILRTYGNKAALAVFIGDFLKGLLAVYIGQKLTGNAIGACIAGGFAMLGHMFPLFFHFRGGKGVATGAGIAMMMSPLVFLCVFVLFCIVLAVSRYMSLASMSAAAAFSVLTIAYHLLNHSPTLDLVIYSIFAVVAGGSIIFMHRSNIRRLLDGTERKFSFKKSA
jgi:glycerol-3-phosphate acyltransferase PlsY